MLDQHIASAAPADNNWRRPSTVSARISRQRVNETAWRISAEHGLSAFEILNRSRKRYITFARQHLMADLVAQGFSLTAVGQAVGRACGGRPFDHTTVLHACRAHTARSVG